DGEKAFARDVTAAEDILQEREHIIGFFRSAE
ncbi:MAG: hypothetical protein JWO80_2074, partial [Bryobacterales bacterium]|nr:hypothetical protein [Bryobacterales bacterium]